MVTEQGPLERLEAKAPLLFLVGAVLYGVGTVGLILTTYTGTSFGADTTFAALGKVLVPLGLLGLYPALAEQRPYLSRAAAAVALIPTLCWSLIVLAEVVLKPTGIVTEPPAPLALTPIVGFVGLYAAFALFGVAALLAEIHPRILGILMVVYAAMFPVWMTVLSGVPDFVSGLFAVLVYGSVGIVLWNADVPAADAELSAEPTA